MCKPDGKRLPFFSLSMLRRHLEQLGHRYKLSEIKEALDILADTRIAVEEQSIEARTGGNEGEILFKSRRPGEISALFGQKSGEISALFATS
jgi:hypothetical protein